MTNPIRPRALSFAQVATVPLLATAPLLGTAGAGAAQRRPDARVRAVLQVRVHRRSLTAAGRPA